MRKGLKYGLILLATCALFAGCRRASLIPEGEPHPGERIYTGCIPENPDEIVRLYIDLPNAQDPSNILKDFWTHNATLHIDATVDGVTSTVYKSEGVKIKGHGNSTWKSYPKKPYTVKLPVQANFIGTGKTKRWVLLANWMDRTCIRNDVAFEAARQTSLAWVSSGTYVELYLNGNYNGLYFLCEKVHAEGSNFTCDFLYSYDISDRTEHDFDTQHGHWKNATQEGGIPIELKFPDRDNYKPAEFAQVLDRAKKALYGVEDVIMRGEAPSSVLDLDSICDWYLINEVFNNSEAKFPKSTFYFIKDGKLHAGPVWDFDYGTFTPDNHGLSLKSTLYYYQLWTHPEFKKHLIHRWNVIKPIFQGMDSYIDRQAQLIRKAEARNHEMWPCYPNPLAEGADGKVNGDELLTFDQAIDRMKSSLAQRIEEMDTELNRL